MGIPYSGRLVDIVECTQSPRGSNSSQWESGKLHMIVQEKTPTEEDPLYNLYCIIQNAKEIMHRMHSDEKRFPVSSQEYTKVCSIIQKEMRRSEVTYLKVPK